MAWLLLFKMRDNNILKQWWPQWWLKLICLKFKDSTLISNHFNRYLIIENKSLIILTYWFETNKLFILADLLKITVKRIMIRNLKWQFTILIIKSMKKELMRRCLINNSGTIGINIILRVKQITEVTLSLKT